MGGLHLPHPPHCVAIPQMRLGLKSQTTIILETWALEFYRLNLNAFVLLAVQFNHLAHTLSLCRIVFLLNMH